MMSVHSKTSLQKHTKKNTAGRRIHILFFAICSTFLLAACGIKYSTDVGTPTAHTTGTPASTTQSQDPLLTESAPIPTTVSPEIKPTSIPADDTPRSLPAAIALRNQAASAASNDNHTRAIGLLERAIRISPQDPKTFAALAESHLAQNRPQQALELTRRALLLNPTATQRVELEQLEQRCLSLL